MCFRGGIGRVGGQRDGGQARPLGLVHDVNDLAVLNVVFGHDDHAVGVEVSMLT